MVDLGALPLVFTRSGALSVGLRRARFERLVSNGELVVVSPGHFADAVRWATSDASERHLALATAACTAFGQSALSHVSAALWWGLPVPRVVPPEPALTVHRTTRPSDDSDWVRVLRCELPERHVLTVGTVRVTSPARTVVDCFRSLPLADALAIADAAVGRGLTPGELVEVRKEQARWPGIRSARRGIGLVDGRRESWLESASVAGLDGWGLPHPSPQVEVRDELGDLIGRVDLFWRGLRVVGEADGKGKFRGEFDRDTSERAVADRLISAEVRAGRLRETGVGVVRWGTGDLRRPEVLAARIRRAAPSGPLRATFRCGPCQQDLDHCHCAPRLCLSDRARDAA
ncbi:MAG TPA: hypothetical protein VFN34_02360 [Ornithinibacter sp.]|nr:hypothetical protein [Ornithinibacter sp.]